MLHQHFRILHLTTLSSLCPSSNDKLSQYIDAVQNINQKNTAKSIYNHLCHDTNDPMKSGVTPSFKKNEPSTYMLVTMLGSMKQHNDMYVVAINLPLREQCISK